jgi:hypothetical protein
LESKDLIYIRMNETIRKKTTLFLVPPFPFVKEDKDKDKKPKATDVIEFLLTQRAGSNATASTYTLKVEGFAEIPTYCELGVYLRT